jgi:YhcH/YjgK/YiaL family protein
MILDTIHNARLYHGAHPLLNAALDMLEERTAAPFTEGRADISGGDLYLIASSARGKPADEAKLEAHIAYIDLHLLLEGKEAIGWKPTVECTQAVTPYDSEKDFMLFGDRPQTWLPMAPGTFAVFFPGDAHAPMVSDGPIRKIVFKIAVKPASGG